MILPRTSWGGPAGVIGEAYTPAMLAVTAHNTYIPALPASATVEQERAATLSMHRAHRAKGWAGIGYNLVIYQSGRIHEARGWGRVGAHAGSYDGNRTLGVAFCIDGEKTTPSEGALSSFNWVREEGVRLGRLTRGHALKFHRDWKATICPGALVVRALTDLSYSSRVSGVTLGRGDRGDNVLVLQELLVRLRYMTAQQVATGPGIFGPQTELAFRTFLAAHATLAPVKGHS